MARPISLKDMLASGGLPPTEINRKALANYLDLSLLSLYESAVNAYDGEHAACVMYRLCELDPKFSVPYWLVLRFRKHKAAILDMVNHGI